MKTIAATLALVIALTATMAQADPYHGRHLRMVCAWHHHHKVCHR
jgi:hypothetical protein